MADTRSDYAMFDALRLLQDGRDSHPCGFFREASSMLPNWCECGWSLNNHEEQTMTTLVCCWCHPSHVTGHRPGRAVTSHGMCRAYYAGYNLGLTLREWAELIRREPEIALLALGAGYLYIRMAGWFVRLALESIR